MLFARGRYFGPFSIIFLKTPLAALKNILFGSQFHSKRGPHFYKFRNPLHVGAVHDALDNIGLFQSVCGQFKLIKVFVVVNGNF